MTSETKRGLRWYIEKARALQGKEHDKYLRLNIEDRITFWKELREKEASNGHE